MTYHPPPVPPRNNRPLRIVLVVVGVVVALCCLGGAVGGWFLYQTVQDAVGPARSTTGEYLDALRDGDHQRAYDRLCQRQRDQVTADEFALQRQAMPKLVEYDITGMRVSTNNGRTTGTASVRLETANGETNESISLLREDGEWRVCP
ncbi:Rv0361 family membrane protein [Micromonospora sp. NPDC003241]